MKKVVLSAAAVFALAVAAHAADDEVKTIGLNEVPEDVLDAATAAAPISRDAPTVKFNDQVEVEQAEGDMKYGFDGELSDGTKISIDVTEAAEVVEVETIIEQGDVPEAILAIMNKYVPNIEFTEIERLVDDERAVVYEFEGTRNGAPIDITVSADATEFEIEEGA